MRWATSSPRSSGNASSACIPIATSRSAAVTLTLLAWLRREVHQHGRKFQAQELVERITGSRIDPAPYLRYLDTKYAEVYEL